MWQMIGLMEVIHLHLPCLKISIGIGYLTISTKKAFNFLRHAFTQVLILQHFDLER